MTTVAARRSSAGGLAIEDHVAPRSALLPPLATDRGALVWHAKAEARRAARALHEAIATADARTSEEFCGPGHGDPITQTVDITPPVDSRNTESATASVGRAARKALRWSLMGAASTRLGGLALGMVLARLLTPEDFGLYAIALSAMFFLMYVNDVGLIAATVQWRGRFEDMAPTATTLALAFSVLVYGLFWVLAPAFAGLAGSREAAPVVRLLTMVILVDGVTAVRAGSLLRTFQQHRITIANLMGLLATAAVAISLAVHGVGALSFAAGQVAGAVVTGALVLWSAHMPWRFGFDRGIARRLLHFGLPLALALGVEAILLNVDYILVGRIMGATALGLYLLAFNISSWAPGVIGTAIRWVSIPSFSRLSEEDGALSPAVHRSITVLVTGVLPIGFLTAVLAPALIESLYGTEWAPSAPALRFLIILGVVRMVTQLAFDVLAGAGAPRAALWLNLGWVITLVPALAIGTQIDGIRGTAVAHALVATFVAAPLALAALRGVGVHLLPIAMALIRPLLGAAVGAATCVIVAHLTTGSAFGQLVAAGGVGLLTYVMIVLPSEQRRRWSEYALSVLRARRRRGSPKRRRRHAASDHLADLEGRSTDADPRGIGGDPGLRSPRTEALGQGVQQRHPGVLG
jgi:O-antigen/teichoic acid export membrane protein